MKQWRITFTDEACWTVKSELNELQLNEKGALIIFSDYLKDVVSKVEEFGIKEIKFLGDKSFDIAPIIKPLSVDLEEKL